MKTIFTRPLLRWAGGKQNLIRNLIEFIPKNINQYRYFEPFLGAGSMFFNIKPKEAILSDYNAHLINFYKMIVKNPRKVYQYLRIHIEKNSKDYYYKLREEFNKNINSASPTQAARFLYLNKTCFNGIFRVNKLGFFNVPYGNKNNPYLPLYEEFICLSNKLKEAEFYCFSYEQILPMVKDGDFIYIDPPYPPLNKSSNFSHYTTDRFSTKDQKRLSIFTNELRKKNCKILISNAETDLIKELYLDWNTISIKVTRYITCKSIRHKVKELIITNYTLGGI